MHVNLMRGIESDSRIFLLSLDSSAFNLLAMRPGCLGVTFEKPITNKK